MGSLFLGLGGDSSIYTADVKDARPASSGGLSLTSNILMLSLTFQQMASAKVFMDTLGLSFNFTSSVRVCPTTQSFMRIPRHCVRDSMVYVQ